MNQLNIITSEGWTEYLAKFEIIISMVANIRCLDKSFVERLWRRVKYEYIYLSRPKTGIELFNGAILEEKQNDFLGAIDDYSGAIKLNPDYCKAYSDRASAKLELKDFSGAISDFFRRLKLKRNVLRHIISGVRQKWNSKISKEWWQILTKRPSLIQLRGL